MCTQLLIKGSSKNKCKSWLVLSQTDVGQEISQTIFDSGGLWRFKLEVLVKVEINDPVQGLKELLQSAGNYWPADYHIHGFHHNDSS